MNVLNIEGNSENLVNSPLEVTAVGISVINFEGKLIVTPDSINFRTLLGKVFINGILLKEEELYVGFTILPSRILVLVDLGQVIRNWNRTVSKEVRIFINVPEGTVVVLMNPVVVVYLEVNSGIHIVRKVKDNEVIIQVRTNGTTLLTLKV